MSAENRILSINLCFAEEKKTIKESKSSLTNVDENT